MTDQSKVKAEQLSKELFNEDNVAYVGQGFFRYVEPLKKDYQGDSVPMISRKGLEREVSELYGFSVSIVTRHDVEDNRTHVARAIAGCGAKERIAILQSTVDYERDQERASLSRASRRK